VKSLGQLWESEFSAIYLDIFTLGINGVSIPSARSGPAIAASANSWTAASMPNRATILSHSCGHGPT
jgi:hypothetical protein